MKSFSSLFLALTPLWALAQSQSLTLEQALAEARAHRASVQSAQLHLEQARLTRQSLGAPSATTLSLGYSSDLRVGGTDNDLTLSHPIDLFGRRAALRNTGDALVAQAEAALRQVSLALQTDVVAAYVQSVAASEKASISRESEQTASRLLEAVQSLVDGGRLPGVQATRVSIELRRVRAARKERESEVAANLRRLTGTLGSESPLSSLAIPTISVADVADDLLARQRPDLLLLNADVAAAEADVRVARTSRSPQLEVQARRSPWQDQGGTYGARVQVSFPLFDYGRSRSEESAAHKKAEAARRALADASRMARTEVDAARIEVQGASEQVASLQAILETSRTLVERTQTGLKEGANTLIDVLDALRALRELEENLVDARTALALAQGRYLQATGGFLEARP